MKKKNDEMDIVFLLDRSGSMSGMEDDTIGGYNSYIEGQKDNNVRITTVLFDDKYEMISNRTNIKDIKKLNRKSYYVRGCTALLDAIGKTINYIESKNPKKVIFIITTDGLENASREYDKNKIKKLIKKHNDWEFMYIGADIDSYSESESIGISRKNTANYKKDKMGTKMLFEAVACASNSYLNEEEVSENWKSKLDDYINDNI